MKTNRLNAGRAIFCATLVVSTLGSWCLANDLGIPEKIQKSVHSDPLEGVVTRKGRFTEADLANLRACQVFASEGASESSFRLIRGVVVVQPESDLSVQTKFGEVKILRGSIALLALMENCLAVLDLHQSKGAGVQVVIEKRVYPMVPGRQYVIAPEGCNYFEWLPKEFRQVAHHEPVAIKLDDGKTLFCGDFSILSALKLIPPLNRMLGSTDGKDKVAVNKMLKNSVILTAISPAISYYDQ
jgi:hypothetical protein